MGGTFRSIAAAAVALLACAACWGASNVPVYDVLVTGTGDAAVREAMRTALVRATGRRDAASDPALAPLIENASRFLSRIRPLGTAGQQVSFDGSSLDREILAAGRSLWPRLRPLVAVVADPADGATRRAVESSAAARGLPVAWLPAQGLGLVPGSPLSREVLMPHAKRLGADAVLAGRGDGTAGTWNWALHTAQSSASWSGSVAEGPQGAADVLADAGVAGASAQEIDVTVRVRGVATLHDFARVSQVLGQLPGVRHAQLETASGDTATFRVGVQDEPGALAAALDGSGRFAGAAAVAGEVEATYVP
jgi:hypothetical protein